MAKVENLVKVNVISDRHFGLNWKMLSAISTLRFN